MQCVNCGKELSDSTKFCPACGAKQPQQSQEQAQYNNGEANRTQYNNQQYSNQNQQYNNQQYSNQNQQYNNQQYSNQNQQYNNQQYNYQNQQGQYQNQYNNAGGYSNMQGSGYSNIPIKRREIAMCIVLSIITCGIYGIYWQICLVDDLNAAVGRQDETSGVMVFLLTLITCGIYGWYWFYKAGDKVNELKARKGIPESSTGLLFLVLQFFGLGIVNYCIIQGELNDVATL